MKSLLLTSISIFWFACKLSGQHVSDFTSLLGDTQDSDFHLPATHSFQYIIEYGDPLTEGGFLPSRNDFTGYVPINESSSNGYLSINSEDTPGGVTILDITLDKQNGQWLISQSEAIDFSIVSGTARNCSGAITPWNTIITCEEVTSIDSNEDGYNDLGWAIEIDPATKKIVDHPGGLTGGDKLWSLGNFRHENAVIHNNRRTVYQGVDDQIGYLYKFVADVAEDLSSGVLYVYKGSKQGSGSWIQLNNALPAEQNDILAQSSAIEATVFMGIEDVDISPLDGKVYLAVKSENRVYRFDDSDPIDGTSVSNFETYVGGESYEISDGTSTTVEPWGTGNDNLAFDDMGNLWVTQDGSNNYVWLVEKDHTIDNPRVKIFARSPFGSEPTGITFTPDYRYMFMSIQHPDPSNGTTTQKDAFGIDRSFDKDVSIVISRSESLNNNITGVADVAADFQAYPNPSSENLIVRFLRQEKVGDVQLIDSQGRMMSISIQSDSTSMQIATNHLPDGLYLLRIYLDDKWVHKKILISRN